MSSWDLPTLHEFDTAMRDADNIRRYAESIRDSANNIENNLLRRAKVVEIDREPGFPRFKIRGLEDVMPYCETPRDALWWAHKNLPE